MMVTKSGYIAADDKILWQSEPLPFKPNATIRAQVKQYQNNSPKLLLVEEGIGFQKKAYNGYIIKRLELERIGLVIELLQQGQEELKRILLTAYIPEG